MCMTEYPFVHKKAIKGAKTSFLFNRDVAKLIPFLLDEKGIINVGGKKGTYIILPKDLIKILVI